MGHPEPVGAGGGHAAHAGQRQRRPGRAHQDPDHPPAVVVPHDGRQPGRLQPGDEHDRDDARGSHRAGAHHLEGACRGVGRGQAVGGVGQAVPVEGAGAERQHQQHDVRRRERRQPDPAGEQDHGRCGQPEGEHRQRREDHREAGDLPVDPARRWDADGRERARGEQPRVADRHEGRISASSATSRSTAIPERSSGSAGRHPSPRPGACRGRGAARDRGTSARGPGRARWSGDRRATRPPHRARGLGHDRAGDRHEAVEQDRHAAAGRLDQEADRGGEVGAAEGGEHLDGVGGTALRARGASAITSRLRVQPSSSMPVPRPVTSSAGRPSVAATARRRASCCRCRGRRSSAAARRRRRAPRPARRRGRRRRSPRG